MSARLTRLYSCAFALWLALVLCGALAACGGGGSTSTGTAGTATPASDTPAASAPSDADAPTGASDATTVKQSTTPNVLTVSVGPSATGTVNMLTTSVTVCVPGTDNCATVDNVQVDTGSQGLRLLASALPAGFALPAVTAGSGSTAAGECAVFGTGYTWGAVRSADVRLAGEVAAALPIQVIADPAVPASAPVACDDSGLAMNDASTLRVNGILGVGLFNADCGANCVNAALEPWYYACDSGTCTASAQPLAMQVSNPVAAFATDNNGVSITLPAIGSDGAPSVTGTLTFGIGTQANNATDTATILRANTNNGFVTTTTSDGTIYSQSYLDSGSNGIFFWSSTLTRCNAWFCPGTPQSISATITGTDGTSASASFLVADADTLFSSGNWAFDNLAGYNGNMFGWGLPFFYGRRVFTAIESQPTPAGAGPYYAF